MLWERQRERDRILGRLKGPHRDDFKLGLSLGSAKEYGSDGQQRGLMVALRVAQAELFQERLSVLPDIGRRCVGRVGSKAASWVWNACPDASNHRERHRFPGGSRSMEMLLGGCRQVCSSGGLIPRQG